MASTGVPNCKKLFLRSYVYGRRRVNLWFVLALGFDTLAEAIINKYIYINKSN
jgi:hypothetical protein